MYFLLLLFWCFSDLFLCVCSHFLLHLFSFEAVLLFQYLLSILLLFELASPNVLGCCSVFASLATIEETKVNTNKKIYFVCLSQFHSLFILIFLRLKDAERNWFSFLNSHRRLDSIIMGEGRGLFCKRRRMTRLIFRRFKRMWCSFISSI